MGILARKGDQEKTFTETAWKILGKNKNGWEQVSNSVAKNANQVVEKAKPQTATNSLEETAKEETPKEAVEVDVKAEFISAVKEKNITKNQIKDYLDSKEISFKAGDSLDKLADVLYTALNGDIAALDSL